MINQIEGISGVKPMSALYMLPKIDVKKFNSCDDEKILLDLLPQEKNAVRTRVWL